MPHSDSSSASDCVPRILHMQDGGLILCEPLGDHIKITHADVGEHITLSGAFARRMTNYLANPSQTALPTFGPLARRHPWLAALKDAQLLQTTSRLLLGHTLGMLFVELTDRCNERCLHCYAESSPACSARLSREEIKRVLEEARTLGQPAVQFTGGDPLLHPDLLFAVQTAHALAYPLIEIYTNGLALREALLEELQAFQPHFALSIYAHDAAVHDRITQTPGSLKRTLKAIRRIQAAKLPLRVGIVLMAENRNMQAATVDFLLGEMDLDATQIGVDVVRSAGRGAFMQDNQPAVASLRQLSHKPEITDAIDMPAGIANENRRRRGKLCISASGDVFPCIFSRRASLGNIRRHSLADIVQALDERQQVAPSEKRWQQCRQRLSCSDCQIIAYALGDDSNEESARQGGANVVT
ncbi:MAG: radical SAM protein [Mariprofundaceae bacterium]|nr:radical SAM protein [Mariprofundaceae bacterium]